MSETPLLRSLLSPSRSVGQTDSDFWRTLGYCLVDEYRAMASNADYQSVAVSVAKSLGDTNRRLCECC